MIIKQALAIAQSLYIILSIIIHRRQNKYGLFPFRLFQEEKAAESVV